MGLDVNGVRFLLRCAKQGVDFGRTATIGRQGLHLSADWLETVFHEFGRNNARAEAVRLTTEHAGYADGLFHLLGARELVAFDNSDYEGANWVHDFNRPLPADAPGGFTAVLDGGSLEHVFEFPTALRSCLSLVAPGGHFLAITPANNFCGHGFYQFSPELMFRVLGEGSGYSIRELLAFEATPFGRWYRLTDPKTLGRRLQFSSKLPVYLLVMARRDAAILPTAHIPQQSDYSRAWQSSASADGVSATRADAPKLAAQLNSQTLIEFRFRSTIRRLLDSLRRPLAIAGAVPVRPQD